MSVLLADDDPALDRKLTRALAHDERVRLIGHAHDAEETLELVALREPEIVMVDVTSPQMHGIELTRRIRDAAPGTRVIALAGANSSADVRLAAEAGAVGYLNVADLPLELVRAILELARA